MNLVITEMWNKVVPDATQPFGTRVLPEFEVKSRVSYPNGGGWKSREEWRASVKTRSGFHGFEPDGSARFEQRPSYGIRGYQLVSLE